MLKHRGVQTWHQTWRQYPVPNRFLGITEEMAETYDEMHLAAQCAVRWRAHAVELHRLSGVLGSRMHVVSYEALQTSTEAEVDRLGRFLAVNGPIPIPQVRTDSLDRWETELSLEIRQEIRSVVGDGSPRNLP